MREKKNEKINSIDNDKKKAVKSKEKTESNLAKDQKKRSYYYDDSMNYTVYLPEDESGEDD